MEIYDVCIEEVALEGLDGITLPTLWLRLGVRHDEKTANIPVLSEKLKNYLWKFLINHPDIEAFELPAPRDEPAIFDRFAGFNEETATHHAIAPDELGTLVDVYPVHPVVNGPVKGSCSTYSSRSNIKKDIVGYSLDQMFDLCGAKSVVLVASQHVRNTVLSGGNRDIGFVERLLDTQYCLLERLGRARAQGELQSVLDKSTFKGLIGSHIQSVSKTLISSKLALKQGYCYALPGKEKLIHQVLLHLTCKYRVLRSSYSKFLEMVRTKLSQQEEQMMLWKTLQQSLALKECKFKKLKLKLIQKKVVESVQRTMKGQKRTRWFAKLLPKNVYEDEEEDSEVETTSNNNEEDEQLLPSLILELSPIIQSYRFLVSRGGDGCSQKDFLKLLKGFGNLEARSICRLLIRSNQVEKLMVDKGAQRYEKLIAKDFAASSWFTKQLIAERKRMTDIIKDQSRMSRAMSSRTAGDVGGEITVASIVESSITQDTPSTSSRITNLPFEPVADSPSVNDDGPITEEDNEQVAKTRYEELKMANSKKGHATARSLKRTNLILQYVRENKVIEGVFPLQKLLQDAEKNAEHKICRKTIDRLITNLHKQNLLVRCKLPVDYANCHEQIEYVMALDTTTQDIREAKNSTKFKLYTQEWKRKCEELLGAKCPDSDPNSKAEVKSTGILQAGLPYSLKRKYKRAQVIHEYLWYLAYGHPAQGSITNNFEEVVIYHDENSWKRFLPPVPDFGKRGWLKIRDVVVQLPLVILCQFHNVVITDELLTYLTSDFQRNLLVRQLPVNLASILQKRKYLTSLYETLDRLYFMGLITMKSKRKKRSYLLDETIYIHRKVSLLDTSISEPGYMKTSLNQSYERHHYELRTFEDVENYWLRTQDICFTTNLGKKKHPDEEEINPDTRHSDTMKKFVCEQLARDDDEVVKDNGDIPGDGRGAGGFDSSLFMHLHRNWLQSRKPGASAEDAQTSGLDKYNKHGRNFASYPKLKAVQVTFTEKIRLKRKNTGGKSSVSSAKRKKQEKIAREKAKVATSIMAERKRKLESKKLNSETVAEKKLRRAERTRAVEAKNSHLKPLTGVRIRHSFTPEEDDFLMRCNVNSIVLQHLMRIESYQMRWNVVSWLFVCDMFLKENPGSPKTVDALRRRSRFIMNNSLNALKHKMAVYSILETITEEERQNVLQGITSTVDELKTEHVYKRLMKYIDDTKESRRNQLSRLLPDTIEQVYSSDVPFELVTFTLQGADYRAKLKSECLVPAVEDIRDVQMAKVENVIYGSFFSDNQSRRDLATQKTFETIPHDITLEVFESLRRKNIVSTKVREQIKEEKKFLPFGVPASPLSKFFLMFRIDSLGQVVGATKKVLESFSNCNTLVCCMNSNPGYFIALTTLFIQREGKCSIDIHSAKCMKSSQMLNYNQEDRKNPEKQAACATARITKIDQRFPIATFNLYISGRERSNLPQLLPSNQEEHIDDIEENEGESPQTSTDHKSIISTIGGVNRVGMCGDDALQRTDDAVKSLQCITLEDDRPSEIFSNDKLAVVIYEFLQQKTTESQQPRLGYPIMDLVWKLLKKTKYTEEEIYGAIDKLVRAKVVFKVGCMRRRLVLHRYADEWFLSASISNGASKWTTLKFLCRPWHQTNGTVHYKTVKTIFSSVFEYIMNNPGCTILTMAAKFSKMLQKVVLVEVVEILVNMKCVQRRRNNPEGLWQFFNTCKRSPLYDPEDNDFLTLKEDGIIRFTFFISTIEKLSVDNKEESSTSSNKQPAEKIAVVEDAEMVAEENS